MRGEKILKAAACAAALVIAGCAQPSANMRVGSQQTYESLEAQRAASLVVQQAEAVPIGAVVIGEVDASRCHRRQGEVEPTNAQVIDDLRALAYGRGADGIANVRVDRAAALERNCWYILTGRATMFRAAKAK